MSSDEPSDLHVLAGQVAQTFVHRLFPSYRSPAFLACPDDRCVETCRIAIAAAAKEKGVETEVIDLRPAPAERLDSVTARLCEDVNAESESNLTQRWPTLLVLDGFDLLEGPQNDPPTYPFRSLFQFDQAHRWLFLGRDWQRLRRMFRSYKLPLYRSADDITPWSWLT